MSKTKPEVKKAKRKPAKRRSARKPITLKNVRSFVSKELRRMARDAKALKTLLKASKRLG
jgi:hypothetical protein